MKKLVFATHNPNKLIEVKHILANKYEILDLNDIGFNEEIIEDKKTIIEINIIALRGCCPLNVIGEPDIIP